MGNAQVEVPDSASCPLAARSVQRPDWWGRHPPHPPHPHCSPEEAIRRGNLECFVALTQFHYLCGTCEVAQPDDRINHWVALAVQHGRMDFLQLFLERDYPIQPKEYATAIFYGHLDLLQLLCSHEEPSHLSSLIPLAIRWNRPDCLAYLLQITI